MWVADCSPCPSLALWLAPNTGTSSVTEVAEVCELKNWRREGEGGEGEFNLYLVTDVAELQEQKLEEVGSREAVFRIGQLIVGESWLSGVLPPGWEVVRSWVRAQAGSS